MVSTRVLPGLERARRVRDRPPSHHPEEITVNLRRVVSTRVPDGSSHESGAYKISPPFTPLRRNRGTRANRGARGGSRVRSDQVSRITARKPVAGDRFVEAFGPFVERAELLEARDSLSSTEETLADGGVPHQDALSERLRVTRIFSSRRASSRAFCLTHTVCSNRGRRLVSRSKKTVCHMSRFFLLTARTVGGA